MVLHMSKMSHANLNYYFYQSYTKSKLMNKVLLMYLFKQLSIVK